MWKTSRPCAVVVSRASVRLRNPIPRTRKFSTVSINCFIERASRSSFHTISVSPLREFERVVQGGPIRDRTRHLLGVNLFAARLGQRVALQGEVLVDSRNPGISDQHRFRRDLAGIG
jgi:hypothetical protein